MDDFNNKEAYKKHNIPRSINIGFHISHFTLSFHISLFTLPNAHFPLHILIFYNLFYTLYIFLYEIGM